MASEEDAADAMPSHIDINDISKTFGDPAQLFQLLDKNNDGRITKEDLQLLLEQFGVPGAASNIVSKYIFQQLDANHNGIIETSDLANAGNILWNLLKKKQSSASD